MYLVTQGKNVDSAVTAVWFTARLCRWHYVEQAACEEQGWCVAVNYWYDMQFDSRYAAYTLVESLAKQAGLMPGDEEEQEDEEATAAAGQTP
jgi:hypothetical protein